MKILTALAFVLIINVLFFFADQAIADINPADDAPSIMNYEDSLISEYDKGNYTLKEFNEDELPTAQGQVSESGNWFTDTFLTIKSWFLDLPGVKHAVAIVNAIPSFLIAIQLPPEIAYAIGFLWHAFSIFLIIYFLKG